jgi:hypothetical protein
VKILVYNQHSNLPGRLCTIPANEGTREVTVFGGSEAWLREMTDLLEHSAHPRSTSLDLLMLHTVHTIREALGIGPQYEEQDYESLRTGRPRSAPPKGQDASQGRA